MSVFATRVRYLSNVPLDNSYANTIYFSDKNSQASYFSSLAVISEETEMTMIKDFNYVIASGYSYAQLQNVNYIMYQNSGISDKWYYGFVTNIEYIADGTTNVTFEIDVLQTWHFDYTLKDCFIERQHSTTDEIGDNILAENLELGDYTYLSLGIPAGFNDFKIYAAYINDNYASDPQVYGNIYSGLVITEGDSNAGVFEDWLGNHLATYPDSVINIFMFSEPNESTYSVDKQITNIDGYVPKNKKLFTYPYNMLYVTDNEGTSATFRFEFFNSQDCQFQYTSILSPNPCVVMVPLNYNGLIQNVNEKMVIDNYPQCAWYSDTYQAYLAQNSTKITNNLVMGTIATAIGAATAQPTIAAGGLASIMSIMAQQADASVMPPQAKGQQNVNALFGIERKGTQFIRACIHADQAQSIDDFWTMYGYPMRKIGTPNRTARPNWTYIKTIGCNLTGGIPYNHIARIKQIYDNGITWWMNGANVGNYSLNNAPASSNSLTDGGE